MHNLPDRFPIRYAIIVGDNWEDNDTTDKEDQLFYDKKKYEMLFRQFLILLQKEVLSEDILVPSAETIKATFMDVEIINISKLNASVEWVTKIEKDIPEMIPGAKTSWRPCIEVFDIGMYSYKGAAEIPAFITSNSIWKQHDDCFKSFWALVEKFGYIENNHFVEFFNSIYKKIKNNTITNFEFYESIAKYTKPIYISTPYSIFWKILDDGFQNGIIPVTNKLGKQNFIEEYTKYNQDAIDNENKITIAVCKNWEELFTEELLALYKEMNFCKNCGKTLPFNYQGRFCPDTKENEECKKERGRERAKKPHKF